MRNVCSLLKNLLNLRCCRQLNCLDCCVSFSSPALQLSLLPSPLALLLQLILFNSLLLNVFPSSLLLTPFSSCWLFCCLCLCLLHCQASPSMPLTPPSASSTALQSSLLFFPLLLCLLNSRSFSVFLRLFILTSFLL